MSSLKIGVELRKMVCKRKLGGGEFSYVSLSTGEERRGKAEVLELLATEEGWINLLASKGSKESETVFMKNVKKQLSFVLFEDQVVKVAENDQPIEKEIQAVLLVDEGVLKTLPQNLQSRTEISQPAVLNHDVSRNVQLPKDELEPQYQNNILVEKEIQAVLLDEGVLNTLPLNLQSNTAISQPVDHNHEVSENNHRSIEVVCEMEPPKKKRKVKMGPASKVRRERSASPDNIKREEFPINDELLKSIDSNENENDSLDNTVPFEITDDVDLNKTDFEGLDKTKGLSDNESEEAEVKPKDKLIFQLASVPNVDEILEVEDLPDVDEESDDDDYDDDDIYSKADEDRRVLVLNVKKISHSKCKILFSKYDKVEHIKRTRSRRNSRSDDLKYKGVYLISFETEEAAQKFNTSEVQLNGHGEVLDKVILSHYEREKFFQRQIQRCRGIESSHLFLMGQLKDVKKSSKLDNCVIVKICSADILDDKVQEYFCGVSSKFIDKFGKPVEEARKILVEGKKPFVEYILIFELPDDAKLFVSSSEVHKLGEVNLIVLLLTDTIKRIRFSQKPKNFVDDKQFSEADNSRRVAIQTINKLKSESEIDTFFMETFSNLESILRCEINSNFLGLYILTFTEKESAKAAVRTVEFGESDFVKNPSITSLCDYLSLREKYLNQKSVPKRRKSGSDEPLNTWKVDYQNLDKVHQEHWGDLETEYRQIYGKIEQEGKPTSPKKKSRSDYIHLECTDVFVVCKGFGDIDERSKQDIQEYFYENHENVVSVFFTSLVFVKFSDLASTERFFTLNYIRFRGRKITPFKLDNFIEGLKQEEKIEVMNLLSGTNSTDDSDDTSSQDSR